MGKGTEGPWGGMERTCSGMMGMDGRGMERIDKMEGGFEVASFSFAVGLFSSFVCWLVWLVVVVAAVIDMCSYKSAKP